jgi:murein DD-endopeptidase MepM/ murein hydrolase activator NlpD
LGSVALPGAFADNLHDKHHAVQKKIHKVDNSLDDSSAQLRQATDALIRAQSDLVQARDYLSTTRDQLAAAVALDQKMQKRLDRAVQRLTQARLDLADGQAEVETQTQQLRAMVASTYEQGDPALMGLSMLLTTQDPSQLTGNLNATNTVVNKESAILSQLRAAKVLLQVREQDMHNAKLDVAAKRRAAAQNLATKKALESQAVQAESQVEQMVSLRQQAHQAALQAKTADLAELQKLQNQRDHIEQMIRNTASTGSGYTGPLGSGNGFLSMPVNGPITSPFGWRIHPIFGYRSLHDGIDIAAACGTPIHAPADGRVLSEYYQTAWGNRIIMDHGVHYGVGVATIANHLSGYAVSVGQHVKRGQVVGYVGTTGWSTGCHTHFTVMENGVAVDPMKWL